MNDLKATRLQEPLASAPAGVGGAGVGRARRRPGKCWEWAGRTLGRSGGAQGIRRCPLETTLCATLALALAKGLVADVKQYLKTRFGLCVRMYLHEPKF